MYVREGSDASLVQNGRRRPSRGGVQQPLRLPYSKMAVVGCHGDDVVRLLLFCKMAAAALLELGCVVQLQPQLSYCMMAVAGCHGYDLVRHQSYHKMATAALLQLEIRIEKKYYLIFTE